MADLLSPPALDALACQGDDGVRLLDGAFRKAGWSGGLVELSSARSRLDLWELSVAEEPAVLVAALKSRQFDRVASLGYTRQARYALSWTAESIALHDTLRWRDRPGDLPLIAADLGEPADVELLLELLSRDQIIDEAPSDLAGETAIQREALPQLLGRALLRLRTDVAESQAYQGKDPAGLDTAVLRLFHQLLYVRVSEDRSRAYSDLRVAELADASQARPNKGLSKLLGHYRRSANSELFEPAGIDIEALPSESLRDVLRQTVEPWEALRLDFSVVRADLAGRLYESYLSATPSEEKAASPGRLFAVSQMLDEREKHATFYTPPALARLIVKRTLGAWVARRRAVTPSDIRVVDCACGSGAFLTAAYEWLRDYFEAAKGRPLRPAEREQLLLDCIYGADVDERALGMAQVQLLEVAEINGRLPNLRENLFQGDSLPATPGTDPLPGQVNWDSVIEGRGPFTSVVGNPPFGSQAKLPARIDVQAIESLRTIYPEIHSFGQDYAYFFLALGLRLLTQDGTAGFVMPRGLLALSQGSGARKMLVSEGVEWITDIRAARVFPGTSASVSTVVLNRRAGSTAHIEGLKDSRQNPRALLDDLSAQNIEIVKTTIKRERLMTLADKGWTPFRVRWEEDLSSELGRECAPLIPGPKGKRDARTGVKPGKVERMVLGEEDWSKASGDRIQIAGRGINASFVPLLAYARDIAPFRPLAPEKRILLPFERDGSPAADPAIQETVANRGGLPKGFRHGYLQVLLGPKVLVRAFAKEPAAVSDPDGMYAPIMRGVHAISFPELARSELSAVTAMLNSAFYQWLLRGLGAPRSDETVEISIRNLAELPWPELTAVELTTLTELSRATEKALCEKTASERILAFRERRLELDDYVFDVVRATEKLRDVVISETLRNA